MDVTIHNPDNIPEEIVQAAIAMIEQEEGRRVVELSIRRTGNPDEYGITGYLVGDLDRFNNAKRAEVEDRVKHTTN